MTGAQIILECLKRQNVDTIFGYPGGAVIPLYDALYKNRGCFRHVLTCHEQAAAHGADGYARATGKVGVCFATSGPGATNIVTAIATAYMDSIPVVYVTGQVPSHLLGKDSFQEVDITAVTQPITKHNFIVRSVDDLQRTMENAFRIAEEGRKGPVLVDVPKDVFLAEARFREREVGEASAKKSSVQGDVVKAAEWIMESERPVIYAGGGVVQANAAAQLKKLAEKTGIPVVNTLMGLGGFPRCHGLSLGMVGMHGLYEANMAISKSDLIIAVGGRFSDRVIGPPDSFAPKARVVHIDIDFSEIGKNIETAHWILGDMKGILEILTEFVGERSHEDWIASLPKADCPGSEVDFHPRQILEYMNCRLGKDVTVATEVGQHQMWTAQYWEFENPRTLLTSGGLGTMGYGMGASVGAAFGKRGERVLLVSGDGSFRMNLNELATLSKYNLPILILLMNNRSLGMVRQWQDKFCDGRLSETELSQEADYVKIAKGFGIDGAVVSDMRSMGDAVDKALEGMKPFLIDCRIPEETGVLPFVPPGKTLEEMVLE
ncbi:MAG TPA: biosynthetic-type acetolactate synthase large subunit [Clostridia bacterium]|nr:biosynthetic-type acetolactate synthase large subunit [Clostridia bacterium]